MAAYRCPDDSHHGARVHLRSNNDKVYECEASHRYFRREENGAAIFVDLISGRAFTIESVEDRQGDAPPTERPRLNFMVDIPRTMAGLDFDLISLAPAEWKMISRMDGRSTLEEVRLLSGLKAEEAEQLVYRLLDAGLIEIRRRGR